MPNRHRTILFEKRRFDLHWPTTTLLWQQVTCWDLVVDMRRLALGWLVPARRSAYSSNSAALGLCPAPLPVVWTAPEDEATAARLLPADRPVVGLGPTANWAGKLWPTERFAALFAALAAGPLLDGQGSNFRWAGEVEHRMAAPLLAALPEAIDLCGKLSLSLWVRSSAFRQAFRR